MLKEGMSICHTGRFSRFYQTVLMHFAANPEDLKGILYHDEHGTYEGESPDTDVLYIYNKK